MGQRHQADCRLAKTAITNTQELDAELAGLYREREVVIELSRKAIQHNASTAQDQTEFNQLNDSYLERERLATERIAELENTKRERVAKGKILERFIRDIKTRPLVLTEFDEPLWTAVVERVAVFTDGALDFEFRNGTSITA